MKLKTITGATSGELKTSESIANFLIKTDAANFIGVLVSLSKIVNGVTKPIYDEVPLDAIVHDNTFGAGVVQLQYATIGVTVAQGVHILGANDYLVLELEGLDDTKDYEIFGMAAFGQNSTVRKFRKFHVNADEGRKEFVPKANDTSLLIPKTDFDELRGTYKVAKFVRNGQVVDGTPQNFGFEADEMHQIGMHHNNIASQAADGSITLGYGNYYIVPLANIVKCEIKADATKSLDCYIVSTELI